MPHRPRPLCAARAALVAALALAVGGGGLVAPAAATVPPVIPAGTVVNVGDQDQSLQTLFHVSGVLRGARYKVNFLEFDSGPLVDAGFAAGRIDVGSLGDLPATVAVSSHIPVRAILATHPIGASQFLIARPGISSLAQLKGKRVAYTTGTSEQAFALRALGTAGLTQKDVTQVDVTLQELGTVMLSGQADASVVSVEQKVEYQQSHPTAKVLSNNAVAQPPSYGYLLATTKALASPAKLAAIKDFARRYIAARAWQRRNRAKWVQDYYVDVEHQTTSEAKQILAAGGLSTVVPITVGVRNALQKVVNLMARSNAIDAPFSVAPLYSPTVTSTFNQILEHA